MAPVTSGLVAEKRFCGGATITGGAVGALVKARRLS